MSKKKEIETKIRTDIEKFMELEGRISKAYKKKEEIEQRDVYFSPDSEDYMSERYPYKWLRLRYESNVHANICFKHFYPEGEEEHAYCDEYEVDVSDPEIMRQMLQELGFRTIVEVHKKRRTYLYDRYLISFDEVADLGCFIEIELDEDAPNPIEVERRLMKEVIDQLGLSECKVELRGYPYLIYYE